MAQSEETTIDDGSIDFNIFINNTNESDVHCKGTDGCIIVNRVKIALEYYEKTRNTKNTEQFINFIDTKYAYYLDDLIHIKTVHPPQQHPIYKENNCDLTECAMIKRHENMEDMNKDTTTSLLTQIWDGIHVSLKHAIDLALTGYKEKDEQKKDIDDTHKLVFIDGEVAASQKLLQSNTKRYKFGRIKKSKKIIIEMANNNQYRDSSTGTTVMDYIYEQMQNEALAVFIAENEYDSESLEQDLLYDIKSINIQSNIEKILMVQSPELINKLKTAIMDCMNRSTGTFKEGVPFTYWNHYKNTEFYVNKKYDSFKHEMLEYRQLSYQQIQELVIKKAKLFITSKAAKSTLCTARNDKYNYGIFHGDSMDIEHLLAIILYCDFSELSRNFTSTFRAQTAFERVQDIKKRNANFFFMSKRLKEVVEYYGITGSTMDIIDGKKVYIGRGPFFCGMSVVMTMPTVSMKLSGPTSTTTSSAIASNFSGRDGIIIQFENTKGFGGLNLRLFDVSWISNFSEEAEQLFFSAKDRLQIAYVLVIDGCKNYKSIFHALYWVDAITNGSVHDSAEIDFHSEDEVVTEALKEYGCGNHVENADDFMLEQFENYILHKTEIHINYWSLQNKILYGNYPNLRNVIVPIMTMDTPKNKIWRENNISNIPNFEFIKIFRKVQNITIYTADGTGMTYKSYSFAIAKFIESIQKNMKQKIKYKICAKVNGKSWIYYSMVNNDKMALQFSLRINTNANDVHTIEFEL